MKKILPLFWQLMNYTELSSTLNISFATVKKYLWYAQKIFLVELITPYARNIRKEISFYKIIHP